jgi:hypothetical protein
MFKDHAVTALAGVFALGLAGPDFAATSGETNEETVLQGTNLYPGAGDPDRRTSEGRQGIRRRRGWPSRQAACSRRDQWPEGVQTVIVDALKRADRWRPPRRRGRPGPGKVRRRRM